MIGKYDVGFITANYVARAAGYPGGTVDDWGALEQQTKAESTLEDVGFDGWLTVEHEPFDCDPMPEIEQSLDFIRAHA